MKIKMKPIAAAMALSLAANGAWAVEDFYLAAKAYTKTLPDGSSVPMWGYVIDPDNDADNRGDCYMSTNAARQSCIDALPEPTFPGPRLNVPSNEGQVRIFLSNGLPEPTSIMIPGQELPFSQDNNGPTWNDNSVGARTDPTQRVRSFGREAPANGGRQRYIWTNGRGTPFSDAGSFIYQSATHPQKQVYMGLAGMITKDAAVGEAYPGVSYDNEVVLFYSDIDPLFNAAVAAGTLETAIERHPTWFLVNGEPYVAGLGDIMSGSNGPLTASSNTLLRLASTASDTHVVVMQGMDMTIHAEDGNQYTWQEQGVGGAKTPAPRKQFSAMLPPAKTKDAVIVAPSSDRFAIYDGDGYMTNPSDPADEGVGDTVGGMLRVLAFGAGANDAPTAADDAFNVVAGLSVTFSPLSNDTDPEGDPLFIANQSAASAGAVVCDTVNASGTCDFDASGLTAGTVATFTYEASDGSLNSAPATVSMTVTENMAPSGIEDSATTDEDLPVDIMVTANDTDPEGQALSVGAFDAVSANGQTVSCLADTCTYTPTGGFTGVDTFTYTVTDGVVTAAAATTVTVTVNAVLPPNTVPVATADTATTAMNTQVEIDVLANDTDGDAGDTLTIDSHDPASANGGTIGCATGVAGGTCIYTPDTGFTGTDTFDYVVTDGTDTATATVTVTVEGAGAPVLYFSTIGAGSVPSVTGPYDDADIYTVDAAGVFARDTDGVSDLGLPNNADIDGMSINGGITYLSFAAASTSVGGMSVPDEDVVAYNGSTWSTFFDGSICGLDSSNGQDIDALSVVGNTLYFSIAGGGSRNPVDGVNGTSDDADVYSWTQGDTTCGKVYDAQANNGLDLAGNADIDGLTTTDGITLYASFRTSTNVPGVGTVQDESVLYFDGNSWSTFFSGAGQLDGANSQNVDAIHVP